MRLQLPCLLAVLLINCLACDDKRLADIKDAFCQPPLFSYFKDSARYRPAAVTQDDSAMVQLHYSNWPDTVTGVVYYYSGRQIKLFHDTTNSRHHVLVARGAKGAVALHVIGDKPGIYYDTMNVMPVEVKGIKEITDTACYRPYLVKPFIISAIYETRGGIQTIDGHADVMLRDKQHRFTGITPNLSFCFWNIRFY